jgi:hypothetical protein
MMTVGGTLFHAKYIVLVCLGGALADLYVRVLSDQPEAATGWLGFVVIWLPAAILLGSGVAYVAPAVRWRLKGARAAASAGRERSVFGVGGSFFKWVLPFALAGVAGVLLARWLG